MYLLKDTEPLELGILTHKSLLFKIQDLFFKSKVFPIFLFID